MASPYASGARARSRSLTEHRTGSTWARHPISVVAARAPIAVAKASSAFVGILVILQVEEGRGARELIGERKRPGPIGGETGLPLPMRDDRANAPRLGYQRERASFEIERAGDGRRGGRLDHDARA